MNVRCRFVPEMSLCQQNNFRISHDVKYGKTGRYEREGEDCRSAHNDCEEGNVLVSYWWLFAFTVYGDT